jgi:hypothetical protein
MTILRARFATVAFVSLLGSLAAVYACDVYDTSLLGGTTIPQGKGVGFWSGKVDGCDSAGVPGERHRPAPQPGAELPPIYVALRTLNLGQRGEDGKPNPNVWQEQGFDLDGVCTNSATCNQGDRTTRSCRTTGSATPFDGDYCRDNTFGRFAYQAALVPEISGRYGLNSDTFNCSLCVGYYNFLVKVSGYNGTRNDDRIRIDLYPSTGLETVLPWDCRSDDWKSRPCFTPDQPWKVQEDVLTGPRTGSELPPSRLFVEDAYVRDGYLVSNLPPDTLFWFPGKSPVSTAFPLKIAGGLLVGRVARSVEGLWTVEDGLIAGRARGADIITSFRQIGLCENDPSYSVVTQFITGNVDISSTGVVDENQPCDALSFGVGFTATQATPGRLEPVAPLVECANGSVSDAGAEGGQDAGGGVDAGGDR